MDFSFGARDQVRLLDGGIGTWLASQDEAHAVAPHQACIKNPSLVSSLHKAYTRAGAQALHANAWLALHLKEAEAERTVRAAADCLDFALENSEGQPAPARLLSMAPGLGTPPSGKVALLDQLSRFDAVVLETLIDPWQLAWVAWLAEWATIPVAVTLVPDNRPGSWDPADFARRSQRSGAKAVGINCGYEDAPLAAAQAVAAMRQVVPGMILMARPALWDRPAWLAAAKDCVAAGANWVGGCCGCAPEDIEQLAIHLRR